MKNFNIDQIQTLDDMPHTHWVAVANKLGGLEGVKQLLRNDVTVELKEAFRLLFDKNARFIPFAGLKSAVTDFNSKYAAKPKKLATAWFAAALKRVKSNYAKAFPGVELIWPSAKEFEQRANAAIAKLADDSRTANALKAGVFAWCLPGGLQGLEHGQVIDGVVEAVKSLYEAAYPGRSFTNYRHTKLNKQVSVVTGTRHEQIVQAVASGEPVIGISVAAFGGFSINAGREVFAGHEMSAAIPDFISLGGGIDTVAMIAMNVEETLHSNQTPVWRCSAVNYGRSDSVYFGAVDSYASFDYTGDLSNAFGHCSALASVLG